MKHIIERTDCRSQVVLIRWLNMIEGAADNLKLKLKEYKFMLKNPYFSTTIIIVHFPCPKTAKKSIFFSLQEILAPPISN